MSKIVTETFRISEHQLMDVKWTDHVAEADLYVVAQTGTVEDFLKLVHGEILSRRLNYRRSIRFVDKRWKWYGFYLAWDYLLEWALNRRLQLYFWLWKHGHLATKEGTIPRWQDIRLFKIRKPR